MSISLKTHKRLWGQSGNRCAFQKCRKELSANTADLDDYFTIGDEAHIISKKDNGPRSYLNYNFDIERVDRYNNLILLCKNHHKCIDSDEKLYTVDKLQQIKKKHESWVKKSLEPDIVQQKEDELLAEYIDHIEQRSGFDNWIDWTSPLLGGYFTKIQKEQFDSLVELHRYLRGRVFPASREELINAIEQFTEVLEDFINHFEMYKYSHEKLDPKYYHTQQLYLLEVISADKQNLHEYMLEELIIELTKAANFICQRVREDIFPAYRMKEGILLIRDAPIMGIAYQRFEYAKDEKYCGFGAIRERVKKFLGL